MTTRDRLPWWAIFLTPAERAELRAIRTRLRLHDEAMDRLGARVRESMRQMDVPPLGAWPPPFKARYEDEEDEHGDDGDHRV